MCSNNYVTKKDYVLITVFIALPVAAAIGGFWYVENMCLVDCESDEEYLQNKVTDQSKQWPVFTSDKLGVSLKYPPRVASGETVFIELENFLIVTTQESDLYLHRQELSQDTDILTFEKYWEIKNKDTHTFPNASWAIWIREITSDAELEEFIDDRFSKPAYDCKLGAKSSTDRNGLLKVNIDAIQPIEDDPNDPGSGCFINWMMKFVYSPKHQKAAMWDLGQNTFFWPNFTKENRDYSSADQIMAESFTFLP